MIYYFLSLFSAISIYFASKYLFKSWNYWRKRGIRTVPYSFLQSFLKGVPFPQIDYDIYHKALKKDEKYVGITDAITGPTFYIKDLDVIKKIMVKDFEYFANRGFGSDKAGDTSSLMLSNSTGHHWKKLRTTLSPIFSTGKIKRLFSAFDKCAEDFDEFIRRRIAANKEGKDKNVIDIQNAFQRYTTSVISRAVFAVDSQTFASIDEDPVFLKMAKRFSNFDLESFLKFSLSIFAPQILKYFKIEVFDSKATGYYGEIVKDAINQRAKMGKDMKFNDFLELMLETRKGEKENLRAEEEDDKMENFEKEAQLNLKSKLELDDEHILAQCLLFFFAGFETTETALNWAAYELAINKEVQDKLRKEIDGIYEKSENGKLDFDLLTNNSYLNNVLNETLRKYPPATATDRKCLKDYYIEELNLTLEKDVIVMIPIYGTHMDPEHFPNPEKFDPTRFEPEEKEKRHPYAFMPFGHGPRNCIGMRFALQEAKILLAHLIRNFNIEPSQGTSIPAKISKKSFFLKPEDGMKLAFKSRN